MPVGAGLAIAGVAGTAGTVIASKDQNKSTQAALDFEKQREAQRKSEYDAQQAQAKAQWDAYQGQLQPYRDIAMQYLKRYGYKPSQGTLGNFGGGRPVGPNRGTTPGADYAGALNTDGSPVFPMRQAPVARGGSLQDIYRDLRIENPNFRSDLAYNQNQQELN